MNRRQVLLGSAALTLAPRLAFAQGQRPLKIGVLNDMSSVYADYQGVGSVIAAKMAVDDFSAQLGVPVEIISADHQNKPDVGAAIARRWFDSGSVDVIMDLPNSAVALAVLAIATEKNKAVIGSGAGTSALTGPKCARNFVHWTYDTYALGHSLGKALTEEGGKTWFFITADYAFGKDMEGNCAAAVKAAGGTVLGSARHPINTADFSSFVLQAQASGADVVGFANAGGDLSSSLKQAHEFGLGAKQRLAGLILNVTNIPSLGLDAVQNAMICTAFYWDFNDGTRAFAKRFQAAHPSKMMPNDMHAGMYAATEHLMKAMAQTKSADDGVKLVDAMKAIPTDDPLFGKGSIRVDGRKMHPMYLLASKTLAESKGDWDYFKVVSTIKPEDAWRPLAEGGCPFVKA
jgi:branched-chain amino acid transport system substrate-binding protein